MTELQVRITQLGSWLKFPTWSFSNNFPSKVVEDCKGLPKAIVTVGKATGKSLDEVVEECKGLPKAIVTVGKATGKSLDEVVEDCKGLPKAIVTMRKATGKSLDKVWRNLNCNNLKKLTRK